MKPVMDPRIVIFVYHKEKPIAMYVSLPELNEIFRYVDGDLNWLGKLKFLYHKWKGTVKTMTGIVFGVAKEFQGKAMEGVMIVHQRKSCGNRPLSTTPYSHGSAISTPKCCGVREPRCHQLPHAGHVPLPLRPHKALRAFADHREELNKFLVNAGCLLLRSNRRTPFV
ncbi:MAG: hypothetical protein LKM36_13845 [Flavobacteriales bacterium]|jgi:hypothetical protein|nr:hypothetical protein [Flavobacteriales bacterium]